MTEVPRLNLSIAEAAESLGVSRRYLEERIYKGEIAVARLGRRVLIPLTEIKRFNESRMSTR